MRTGATTESEREVHSAARAILLLVGVGLLCISVQGSQVGFDRLHLLGMGKTLNDQVVYVDAARHLRRDGELTTGVIYPSTLRQQYSRNYMYMPGHAAITALFFLVFGDSPAAALAVNVLSYLLCILMVFLIGRRIEGHRIGVVAALLFAVFPMTTIYACTAMAEMTFLFACLAVLAVFVHLTDSVRVWLAPILLTLPFLFRETGALWIIPMVAADLELGDFRLRTGLKRAFIMAFLACIILSGILFSGWISNRPSLFRQNLLGVTLADKYLDAFSVPQRELSASDWVQASLEHAEENLTALENLLKRHPASLQALSLAALFLACLVLPFVVRGRRWPLRIALLSLGLALFVLLALVYRFATFIGVRHMLLVLPLEAIFAAFALDSLRRRIGQRPHVVAVAVLVALGLVGLMRYGPSVTEGDGEVDQLTAVVRQIDTRTDGTLVANADLGLVYVYLRPGGTWAFTPWNPKTLDLLNRRFGVSAAVLSPVEVQRLGGRALNSVGLSFAGSLSVLDRTYSVFVERNDGPAITRIEAGKEALRTPGLKALHSAGGAGHTRKTTSVARHLPAVGCCRTQATPRSGGHYYTS